MLKIGLTSVSLTNLPKEQAEPIATPTVATIDRSQTISNEPFFTITGRVRNTYSLIYRHLPKVDFDLLKTYSIPYSPQEYFVELVNSKNTVLFSGFAFVEMSGEEVEYDGNFYNCELIITPR